MIKRFSHTIYFYLLLFCVFHVVVWTIIPAVWYPHPPQDAVEGVAWGQMWLWGYNKHPFLAPWLTAAVTQLFGVVGWPIYFLGQLAVALCFYLIFELGRRMMRPAYAVLGVVMLEAVVYYNYQAANFNPNVAMLPLWAWMMLSFYLAITRGAWRDFVCLGVSLGLAMDAKYQSALLLFVFVIYVLCTPALWRLFKDRRVYFAVGVSILVFMPNFLWLAAHHFIAVGYAAGELGSFTDPVSFVLNQVYTLLPMLLFCLPFVQHRLSYRMKSFDFRFLLWMSLGPFVLTLVMAVLFHMHLQLTWAYPYFSTLGLLCVALLKPDMNVLRARMVAGIVILVALAGFVGVGWYYHVIVPRDKIDNPPRNTLPGKRIAEALNTLWVNEFHRPLHYVGGSYGILVDLSVYVPSRPTPYFDMSTYESPWIDPVDVKRQGALVVVWLSHEPPKIQKALKLHYRQRYPDLCGEQNLSFVRDLAVKAPPVKLWVAFLPPAGQSCHSALSSTPSTR